MAKYSQGDIVFLKQITTLPDGKQKKHPFIILSSERANSYENYYTGAMVTHSQTEDSYTFWIEKGMTEREGETTQVRTYIITGFREVDVQDVRDKLKKQFIPYLIEKVKDVLF